MTDNRHESIDRVQRYALHVKELAVAFKVRLRVNTRMLPEAAYAGTRANDRRPIYDREGIVVISPVVDESTYAVALHELGHCVHPLGRVHHMQGSVTFRSHQRIATLDDVRLLLLAERSAWEWAQQHALEWTDLMQRVRDYSFSSYRTLARRLGIKESHE